MRKSFVRKVKTEADYRKRFLWIVTAVLAVTAVCCVGYAVHYYHKLNRQEAHYEELRVPKPQRIVIEPEVAEVAKTPEEMEPVCDPIYDFENLREENADIYAWITVPGTQVDYPVLQSETDNYYLECNLDGSPGYPGCIYTNKCNQKDFSDYNTVLYGHNMKNGSMFGCLHSYEEQEFFDENREIIVYTEEGRLTYEIYAAVKFTDVYIPAYYDLATADGRDAFLSVLLEESADSDVSHVDESVEIQPEDRLITLSTCVKGEQSKRWLVVGRLVEKAAYRWPVLSSEASSRQFWITGGRQFLLEREL